MSLPTNETLVRWYYDEALSTGDLDHFDNLVAEDFVDHEQLLGIPSTRAGLKQMKTHSGLSEKTRRAQ